MWIEKSINPSKKTTSTVHTVKDQHAKPKAMSKPRLPKPVDSNSNNASPTSAPETTLGKKHRAKKTRRNNEKFSEVELEWAAVSNSVPPPLPAEDEILTIPGKSRKNKRKRQGGSNGHNMATAEAQQMRVDDADSWGWSEVRYPESMLLSDDLGGFVCLEELDDVDVEYIGDERTGRTVTFKKVKNSKKKSRDLQLNPAEPEKPLSIEETRKYYDLDTFDEELAAQHAATEDNDVDTDGENMDDVMDNDIMSENVEDEKIAPENSKTKAAAKAKTKQLLKQKEETKKPKRANDAVSVDAAEVHSQLGTKAGEPKGWLSMEDVDTTFDVSAWDSFNLALPIVRALQHAQFGSPTPIQQQALPLAIQDQDVIGAAETGSGKTLAFGIPIIQYLLNRSAEPLGEGDAEDGALAALVLTPTRELAIQVKDHIARIACFTQTKVMTIVGGMSVQKQRRLLENKPDVIVATPGRLWEVFSENEKYLKRLQNIKFLVLDEADRLLETGHYRELNHILSVLSRRRQNTNEWPDAQPSKGQEEVSGEALATRKARQTFVFTATLSKDLRFDLKKKKHKQNNVEPNAETGTMADLMHRLDFTDALPAIVDVTTSVFVASTLVEAKLDCIRDEKDVYLYYFVTRYPGRTIVFVNSIDALRRLTPTFQLLGVEVLGLHAQMQQRQRLKNLDRFKQNDKAVLVASDVAARGLDIPLVEHVVHYQLPRSGEIYVHRSGRTARAQREGVSLMLCGADEVPTYKKLCQALKKPNGYPDFPVDHGIVSEMKKRVALAKKIDKEEHYLNKSTHDDDWMRKTAEAMDIELDDKTLGGGDETDRGNSEVKAKVRVWRGQLKEMLARPLMPHGASAKYLTSGTMRDLVERLMDTTNNTKMPAFTTTKAVDEIKSQPVKKQKNSTDTLANIAT